MSDKIIELTREWGVAIVGCTNAETALGTYDGADCGLTKSELLAAGHRAADKELWRLIHSTADGECNFAAWHGGKIDQFWVRIGRFAASFYRRELTAEEDEITEHAWKTVVEKIVPAVILFGIEEILSRADAAFEGEVASICQSEGAIE